MCIRDSLKGPVRFVISAHVVRSKAFHPNIEMMLLQLQLNEWDDEHTHFETSQLTQAERRQLAKFIVALPYLEVRKKRIDDTLWSYVENTLSTDERTAWQSACKAYIRQGTPF